MRTALTTRLKGESVLKVRRKTADKPYTCSGLEHIKHFNLQVLTMTTTHLPKRRHISNGKFYDPQTQYYFVSYHIISDCKWVRLPFLTLSEVKEVLEGLPFLLTPAVCPSNNIGISALVDDHKNLQIYSESWLSELHQDWSEETQKYTDSDYTNRQIIFDDRYEQNAVHFTGIPSLSRQNDEAKDAWQERVERHRSAQKQKNIERLKLHDQLSEHQGDPSALFELKIQN